MMSFKSYMTIAMLVVAFALTGCAGTKKILVTEYKYQTVDVPEQFYKNCNNEDFLKTFPEAPVTLGSQAAEISADWYRIGKSCQISNQAIKEFLDKAKVIIERGSDPKTVTEKLSKLAKDVREKYKL